jgi:hypothetical protein
VEVAFSLDSSILENGHIERSISQFLKMVILYKFPLLLEVEDSACPRKTSVFNKRNLGTIKGNNRRLVWC